MVGDEVVEERLPTPEEATAAAVDEILALFLASREGREVVAHLRRRYIDRPDLPSAIPPDQAVAVAYVRAGHREAVTWLLNAEKRSARRHAADRSA